MALGTLLRAGMVEMDERDRPITVASGAKADYGIDAPGVVLAFTAMGVIALFAMTFAAGGNAAWPLIGFFSIWAVLGVGTAILMMFASKSGKKRLWERTLDGLALGGDERSLDVGCGRGLVLVETAKRLPHGRATGIDIWRSKDQSGNARVVTEANAAAEHVADRVDVRDGDMRELPFPDGSFELVTASLAIHNIKERSGRDQAVREISRVLSPGGRAVIVDIAKIDEYQAVLRAEGLDVERSGMHFSIYPPARTLTARKT